MTKENILYAIAVVVVIALIWLVAGDRSGLVAGPGGALANDVTFIVITRHIASATDDPADAIAKIVVSSDGQALPSSAYTIAHFVAIGNVQGTAWDLVDSSIAPADRPSLQKVTLVLDKPRRITSVTMFTRRGSLIGPIRGGSIKLSNARHVAQWVGSFSDAWNSG